MKLKISRSFLAILIVFVATMTGFNIPSAHAEENYRVMYLTFTPDPSVEKPLQSYRIEYWNEGQAKQKQMFASILPNGDLYASVGLPADTGNFYVYRTDTLSVQNGQKENKVWESAVFKNVRLGNSVYAK